MTVSAIDLRIGRACLVRSDITESLREQQGLLNMIAYTFELACFINMNSTSLTMYTRETVLKNLAPNYLDKYEDALKEFALHFGRAEDREETSRQFRVETMVERLGQKPEGYDFVFPYEEGDEVLYKQINVLWGDENHRTICMVRGRRNRYAGGRAPDKTDAGEGACTCRGGKPGKERISLGHEP